MDCFKKTLKEQGEILDKILKKRLNVLLPSLMKELEIKCWIVIGREYNEDPILKTMLPSFFPNARRTTMLMFLNIDGEYKKFSFGSELEPFYDCINVKNKDIFEALQNILEIYNPKTVAINVSSEVPLADGLTKSLFDKIISTVEQDIISAEKLCIRWLETRIDDEIEIMEAISKKTHEIIKTSFSRENIIIGQTSTYDLEWFMRDCIRKSGGEYWFGPDVDFQRIGEEDSRKHGILKAGDIIHCDIGIQYMGYNSDIQRVGYILKSDELEVPPKIQQLLFDFIDFQDVFKNEFIENKTGNEVFQNTMKSVEDKSYHPMIYTHPIGFHGHGAGPAIGKYDNQGFIPIEGELKINNRTCYAMELNISNKLSIWNDQTVYMYLEEDIIFINGKVKFLDERQELIIKI